MALVRKALLVNTSNMAGLAMHAVQTVILTRALGPAKVGQYAVVASAVMLAAQLFGLGLPSSMLYHCQHDRSNRSRYACDTIWVTIAAGLIGTVAVAAIMKAWPPYFGHMTALACLLGSLYVLLTPVSGIFRSLLLCDLQARRLAVMAIATMAAPLAFVAAMAMMGRLEVTSALIALLLGPLVRILVGTLWTRADLGLAGMPRPADIARLAGMGVRLGLGDLMVLVHSSVGIFVLKAMVRDFQEVGQFSRAQQLAMALVTATQALLPLLFSRWAGLCPADICRHFESVMRVLITFSAAAAGLTAVLARPLILLLYGQAYLPAAAAMTILVPGAVAYLLAKVTAQLLASRGRPGTVAALLLACASANAWMSIVFIPTMGARGAALAQTSANVCLLAGVLLVARHCFGVRLCRCLWIRYADCMEVYRQVFAGRSCSRA